MMIYNLLGINESYSDYGVDFDIDTLMEDTSIVAAPEEDLHEATFRVANEMELNWVRIKEAACLEELRTFAESGETEVVTEATFGFLTKGKEWFMKLWHKVQEIFKNVLMYFSAKFGKNDAFFRKYQKSLNTALNSKSFTNMKFTGYTFKNLEDNILTKAANTFDKIDTHRSLQTDMNANIKEQDLDKLETTIKNEYTNDKKTDKIEEARKNIYQFITGESVSSGMTDKEFKSDLDEYLKGSTSKEQLDINSDMISRAFNNLKTIDKQKSEIEKSLRIIKKSIDGSIKEIESLNKELNKSSSSGSETINKLAGKKAMIVGWYLDVIKTTKTISTTACGIIISNVKLYAAQSRMLAAKAITYNSKKFEESTTFGGGSLLDSVELI